MWLWPLIHSFSWHEPVSCPENQIKQGSSSFMLYFSSNVKIENRVCFGLFWFVFPSTLPHVFLTCGLEEPKSSCNTCNKQAPLGKGKSSSSPLWPSVVISPDWRCFVAWLLTSHLHLAHSDFSVLTLPYMATETQSCPLYSVCAQPRAGISGN